MKQPEQAGNRFECACGATFDTDEELQEHEAVCDEAEMRRQRRKPSAQPRKKAA